MEVRTQSDTHITIRYSEHEIEVLKDLVIMSSSLFVNKFHDGEYADKSKGYKTTANKICNGWSIVPKFK